jgi:hypothetical protein
MAMTAAFTSNSLLASLLRIAHLLLAALVEEASGRGRFRLSVKRMAVLLFLGVFLPVNAMVQHFGLALDSVLFPSWSSTPVHKPVFIVSNARSGSTLLHRALLDRGRAQLTSPSLFEIVFAQSVSFRWFWHYVGELDRRLCCGGLRRALRFSDARLERWSFANAPHPFSLLGPEEDEWMMSTVGACQLLALLFPQLGASSPLARLARGADLSAQERSAIYGHYRALVQRHLFFAQRVTGNGSLRYLAKNPTFTLRLDAVLEEFPDAHVVVAVRDPHHAVPSMVSYISRWWHVVASPLDEFPQSAFLRELCDLHYVKPIELAQRRPFGVTFVKFQDLVRDRNALVEELLQELQCPPSAALANYSPQADMFHHPYSLQHTLGMSQAEFEASCKAFLCYPEYLRARRGL